MGDGETLARASVSPHPSRWPFGAGIIAGGPTGDAMPSPFPGMNPYLEQDDAWHSFHERFCTRLADELVAHTGPRYLVKLDESVFLHELPAGERRLVGRPDV